MSNNQHWMIVYDIKNKKRLAKVERCVTSYGWRLQNSVYEANTGEDVIDWLKIELSCIVKEEDFVLIFQLCEKDWQKREFYGKSVKEDPMKDNFIIL